MASPLVPERPVLVAPDSFKGTFRATEVAAAVGRGLEAAGLVPPDLCPVADGGAGALEAIDAAGGLGGARVVVLCDVRVAWERAAAVFAPQKGADPDTVRRLGERLDALARRLPRDPRGVAMTGAAGGLAGGLWAAHGAALEPGASFVLDALDFDARMRAARCVITGEGRLDAQTLEGKVVGEIGTRTRQAGVPLHAIVGQDALDRFSKRMIDLQAVREASTRSELEAAGEELGGALRELRI